MERPHLRHHASASLARWVLQDCQSASVFWCNVISPASLRAAKFGKFISLFYTTVALWNALKLCLMSSLCVGLGHGSTGDWVPQRKGIFAETSRTQRNHHFIMIGVNIQRRMLASVISSFWVNPSISAPSNCTLISYKFSTLIVIFRDCSQAPMELIRHIKWRWNLSGNHSGT